MGWTTTAPTLPSGSSYGGAQTYTVKGNWWGYTATISIARLSTNQVSIRFVLDAIWGSEGYNPPYAWYLGVGSNVTKSYTFTDRTVYWTGTLAAGSTVQTSTAGYNQDGTTQGTIQKKTFTGPAYVTKYTVAYNANGGSGAPASQTKTYGTALTLRTAIPARSGYTFVRWNTKADGSGTGYAAGASYTTNAAVTLYAIWAANTYAVTYNANGGTGTTAGQTKTYGEALTLSDCGFTRDGYTFRYWNTKADGTGTTYAAGASYTANAAVTLYAIWQVITYAVTYDGNGATGGATEAQTKTWGVSLALRSSGFTRTGYAFTGWNTAADGSGTAYAAGASYTVNAAVTLYAQWIRANIPVYVNDGEDIRQVEKAYANVNGEIRECTVYANVGGVIKTIV